MRVVDRFDAIGDRVLVVIALVCLGDVWTIWGISEVNWDGVGGMLGLEIASAMTVTDDDDDVSGFVEGSGAILWIDKGL